MLYRRTGFTLIELMLVIALIMILSIVGVTSFTLATVKSKDTQRKGEINQIVRALESFNQDIGRYPLSDTNNAILCYVKENGVVSNPVCDANKLYARIDGETTSYMTIPTDPDPNQKYVYVSSDGSSFDLYAALENTSDKDLLTLESGQPDLDPWGVSCGSEKCNYKVTDTGLAKTK